MYILTKVQLIDVEQRESRYPNPMSTKVSCSLDPAMHRALSLAPCAMGSAECSHCITDRVTIAWMKWLQLAETKRQLS
jgi:hypothetical protein